MGLDAARSMAPIFEKAPAAPAAHRIGGHVPLFVLLTALAGLSCQRPIRSGALIDAYRHAVCVDPTVAAGIHQPTRGWDTSVALPDGSRATIQGAEKIAGQILIRYEPDGPVMTAAKPGDYIYPSDVRHDAPAGRLYVKARGLAGGISDETWLYEYDLQNRRPLRKQRVHPASLPAECELKK